MTAADRTRRFLQTAADFRLGHLVTEGFHPATEGLDAIARRDAGAALARIFEVDADVLAAYRAWTGRRTQVRIGAEIAAAVSAGRRVAFVGCGATGRLAVQIEQLWRRRWLNRDAAVAAQIVSVPAGGDYALVRSVEGFEDRAELADRQLAELGLGPGDIVFAVTEGGETPFVIGAAQDARSRGAKVFFVYCNPDDLLASVPRSRAVLEDAGIEKMRLVTGPMAVSGSTRMQATTIQQLVLLTTLEAAIACLDPNIAAAGHGLIDTLSAAHQRLADPTILGGLARIVECEEEAYRRGLTAEYVAGAFALDVLTDTTERSPTFSVPPLRKAGDEGCDDAWARLWCPHETPSAWEPVLQRTPRCLSWPDVAAHVGVAELLRYRIGCDGSWRSRVRRGSLVLAIVGAADAADETFRSFLDEVLALARSEGSATAALLVGVTAVAVDVDVAVRLPSDPSSELDPIGHAALKMTLNALSTVVMARLGRVLGNCMACVTPTNNKLIDRATRYVAHLADLEYNNACERVFAALEEVEPALHAGRAFPPVVPLAVAKARQ